MTLYRYQEYNTIYKLLFEEEEARLRKYLGDKPLIEHFGSTAIPGVGGKGIIDIYVAADKDQMEKTSKMIVKAGYTYKPSKERLKEELMFHRMDKKDEDGVIRRYHLHLTYFDSEDWKKCISFRDFLRKNKDYAKKYSDIKKKAIRESSKGKTEEEKKELYSKVKRSLMEEITAKLVS